MSRPKKKGKRQERRAPRVDQGEAAFMVICEGCGLQLSNRTPICRCGSVYATYHDK